MSAVIVAIRPGRYPLHPIIVQLEERRSDSFFRDVGGISLDDWMRWAQEGLTANEAARAAGALGVLVASLWPNWRPEAETDPTTALIQIEHLRRQLETGVGQEEQEAS